MGSREAGASRIGVAKLELRDQEWLSQGPYRSLCKAIQALDQAFERFVADAKLAA